MSSLAVLWIIAVGILARTVQSQQDVNHVTWYGISPPYQTVEPGATAELTCLIKTLYPLPTLMYWVAAEDNRPLFNSTDEVTVAEWRNDTTVQGKLILNNVTRTRHVNCVAIQWQNGSMSSSTSNAPSTVAVMGTNDDPKLSWWMVSRDEPLVNGSGIQISEPGPQASGAYVSVLKVVEPVAPLALFYCTAESEGLRAYSNITVVYTADFTAPREGSYLSPLAIALIVVIVVLIIAAILIAIFVRRRRVASSRRF